jgi:WD repeat-containing protein 48
MKSVNPVQLRAEETYEILCQDQLLPLDMTLAAVQHFVWRQRGGSGELVMHYRRRRKAE